jgi:predicted transcriptional regulator of viral defense system
MRRSAATGRYGGAGGALVRALVEQGHTVFTVAEAREASLLPEIADSYLLVLLHRLERAGWIRRLKRGVYALATGLSGVPEVHPFTIGMALVDPCAVSGWAALNHHGMTEQVPQVVTLSTPKRVVTPAMRTPFRAAPSVWEVAGQRFEILTVVPSHFFGDELVWVGQTRARVFDRERALLDCFALPRRFGGLAEGLAILEDHVHELNLERLVSHAKRYGAASVARRIGWALDRCAVPETLVAPLLALPARGYRPLDPARLSRGHKDKRWRLVNNLSAPRRTT